MLTHTVRPVSGQLQVGTYLLAGDYTIPVLLRHRYVQILSAIIFDVQDSLITVFLCFYSPP